jgi:hypothetical protein
MPYTLCLVPYALYPKYQEALLWQNFGKNIDI